MIYPQGKFFTDAETSRPAHLVRWENSYIAVCDTRKEARELCRDLNLLLRAKVMVKVPCKTR